MRRATQFVKKTRKGGVLKVVREHYLRDDVVCGSLACDTCDATAAVLARHPLTAPPLFPSAHYVLPDTNVLLHQMDVLEHRFFHDVVVLETVLDEAKHRSQDVYERVRRLIADPARRFFVLLNERHAEMYIERAKDETPNDRNDRAIRTAVLWYKDHIAHAGIDVVLLTEDADNLAKARDLGCSASTVFEYVDGLHDLPDLRDALVRPTHTIIGDGQAAYDEYLDQDAVDVGLKTGALLKGAFNIAPYNQDEAVVWVQGADMRVIIEGTHNMNRAVHDDQVIVELLPREQWQRPSAKADMTGGTNAAGIALAIDEPVLSDKQSAPTGKVVAISRRHWRAYCGSLLPRDADGTDVLFAPVDRRIPRIWLQTSQEESLRGKRIVVAIDAWPPSSAHPCGHYIRTLGDVGDRATETEVILVEHDIAHDDFSHAVLSCLPPQGDDWTVARDGGHDERRRDLRHLAICSVDPPGCTDIDDALHVRPLDNGNYEVGVHIADVTYFVRPGTAMDREAAQRGTTVYLVDRRIDMLPPLLGTNLCSLHCDVDRFAFSVLWELTPEAEIVSTDFCKSIIQSRASFTYDQAQQRIDDEDSTDDLSVSLRTLNALAKRLNAQRRDNGALTLASPEVRFSLERNSQDPLDVEMKEMKEANSMVEEFMLLANISVAQQIYDVFQQCSLLRRHAVPAPSRFDYLRSAAESNALTVDPTSSKTLAQSLDDASDPARPYLNRLIRILTTRCMTQAQYICSGVFTPDQFYHYGLAASIYTHFTSPIRRYADVVVHRLLAAAVDADTTFPEMLDKDAIHRVARNLNRRHKLAQLCGRASVQLYTVLFFRGKRVVEDAYIIRILENAIVVLIPRYGIESSVPVDEHSFVYDSARNRLASDELGVAFTLFQTVSVAIATDESDQLQMRLAVTLESSSSGRKKKKKSP